MTDEREVGRFMLTPEGSGVPLNFWADLVTAVGEIAERHGLSASFDRDFAHVVLTRPVLSTDAPPG